MQFTLGKPVLKDVMARPGLADLMQASSRNVKTVGLLMIPYYTFPTLAIHLPVLLSNRSIFF